MFLVLYASQGGNSEFIARQLVKKYTTAQMMILDNMDMNHLNKFKFIVFVVSTHGRGDSPFNGSEFVNKLNNLKFIMQNNSHNKNIFKFTYAILGLGSTSYLYYNQFSKDLYKLFNHFGARPAFYLVLSDANDPSGFYTGCKMFLSQLDSFLQSNPCIKNTQLSNIHEYSSIQTYSATVTKNKRLTDKSNEHQIGRMECIINNNDTYKFKPGDCLGILPENTYKIILVDEFNKRDENNINSNDNDIDIYDFSSSPHWGVFNILHEIYTTHYSTNEIFSKKLKELSSDYDAYFGYTRNTTRKSILHILVDFGFTDHVKHIGNKTYLLHRKMYNNIKEYLNYINYRWYTVSSSDDVFGINYNCDNKHGLNVNYLVNSVTVGSKINVKIGRSKLYLGNKNILLFCTGTGFTIAEAMIKEYKDSDRTVRVYYGHRNDEDCLLHKLGISCSTNITVKCARSQIDKKYISHIFKEEYLTENKIEDIEEWIVVVCGRKRIINTVKNMLEEIYERDMEKNIQAETW